MNLLPLYGQVAVVTGAARRIGRVIALTLAEAGASVVVNYHTSRAAAEGTVREIEALGREAFAARADVSKPKQVETLFRAAEKRFGQLDILVNNAALFFPRRWDELTEADWDTILGTNLKGTFFCAQAAARRMRGSGHIVNISSLGGLEAWPGYAHYCVSKAGVIMLTRCLAKALAPTIRVNSVAPGTILLPEDKSDPQMMRRARRTPLRRGGRAEDVAGAVLFLVTQDDFITGQVIVVDGGQSA